MSDKNLEQRINIKFLVKIGKNARKTLTLLAVAYGEYAMKKSNGIGGSRKGEKLCKMIQEVGSQKRKGLLQIWTECELWCLRSKIRSEASNRRIKYEQGNSATDYYGGNEKNFRIDGASKLDR
jgi:hypothetical protein